jgi:hypothetical protein
MMTAVGQKADFCTAPCSRKAVPSLRDHPFGMLLRVPSQGLDSGAKRSGNTPAVLPQRATPKFSFLTIAPWGCGDNRPEAVLVLRLQPAAGMLAQNRLACGPFLPQQSRCD